MHPAEPDTEDPAHRPWERGAVEPRANVLAALGAHPPIADLIDAFGPYRWELHPPFPSLVRSVVGQSVSSASAAAVHGRLRSAVELTPAAVARADRERLRATGLSWAKVDTLQRVAAFANEGGLDGIADLTEPEVASRLTVVKGIGPWTAEMFMIFCLGRLDVWPVGDLAVRQEVEQRFDVEGRSAVREVGERFRPFRSVVTWYLWRGSLGPAQG